MRSRSIEIAIPFRVGQNGGIATTADRNRQAFQHLLSIIGTSPPERVMRTTYGAGATRLLFTADDPAEVTSFISRIYEQVSIWAPEIEVTRVVPISISPEDGEISVEVSYRRTGVENEFTEIVHLRSGD